MNAPDIPIEKLYQHPVVQELLDKVENKEDLEEIKIPYVIKNKILMSPGVWNDIYYNPDQIHNAYLKTDWSKKSNRALYLDHMDGTEGRTGSLSWVGEVKNPRMEGDDLVGDLVVVDKPTAIKLAYGAKMGISPKVVGQEKDGKLNNFTYDNFSIVMNPAVKTAYINKQKEENKMTDEEKQKEDSEEAKSQDDKTSEEETTEKKEVENEKEESQDESEEKSDEDSNDEEEVENDSSVTGVLDAFTETQDLAKAGKIVEKAKEIKENNETWQDAIKRSAKIIAKENKEKKMAKIKEQASKVAEALGIEKTKAMEALKSATKNKENALSEEDMKKVREQASQLADVLDIKVAKVMEVLDPILNASKDKKKYPEPKKEPEDEDEEENNDEETDESEEKEDTKENSELEKIKKENKELSEKLKKVEAKLNEPDKKTIKSEEMSNNDNVNPDKGFLSALQSL